ncbi:MAG: OmpA family protein [Paludibacter sp.]|jgi:outer membrane protein OmpA-like peptidoglycan-associated protein|nr:OmpA family protein [Paludibacter sp.]
MKTKMTFIALFVSAAILLSGCKALTGGLIGGGAGAAIGAGLGALIGKDGKSAAIGAAIGGAVGATTGSIIGNKMDKAAAEAAAIEGAKVETVTDANNLKAVKVTFDSGILFASGSSTLTATSKTALAKFANIMKDNATMEIKIVGYTDNAGWANSTAEQSKAKNKTLSEQRATSVSNYLKTQGVAATQIADVLGAGEDFPVADNSTKAGQQQNRRVEVYIYASEQMIKDAEKEAQQ